MRSESWCKARWSSRHLTSNFHSIMSAALHENVYTLRVSVGFRCPSLFAMVVGVWLWVRACTHLPHRLTTKVSKAYHMVMHCAVGTVRCHAIARAILNYVHHTGENTHTHCIACEKLYTLRVETGRNMHNNVRGDRSSAPCHPTLSRRSHRPTVQH